MNSQALRRLVFPLLLIMFPVGCVHAECSTAKIKKMAAKGKTVSAIAKSCDMDKSDVREALEEDVEEEDDVVVDDDKGRNGKLPQGTPLGQCGCWGNASAADRQSAPQCRKGYARPQVCPGMCPNGGSPWVGVCA